MKRKDFSFRFSLWYPEWGSPGRFGRRLLPTPGNVLFTLLLVVAVLLWAGSAGALPLDAPAAAGVSTWQC